MGVAQALLKEDLSHIALQLHSKTAHDVERAMASHLDRQVPTLRMPPLLSYHYSCTSIF